MQRLHQFQQEYQQTNRAQQSRELEQRLAQPILTQLTGSSATYNQNRANLPNSSSYRTNAFSNHEELITDIDDSNHLVSYGATLWQQINAIQNIENRLENQPVNSSNFNSTISKF
jgi:hypothetical protein